jgi:putative membrane protein
MQKYFFIYLKGIAMGAADVVPGVSGGTIAFISGIYERLINAIRSINAKALQYLFKFDFKGLWSHIDANFLIALFAGIFTSLLSLSRLVLYLMENHPILLWSFFLGLVLASAITVGRTITQWNIGTIVALLAGIVIAFYVTVAVPVDTPTALWFIFLSGALAICAMILPGISGSFILLLMGKYHYIFSIIKEITGFKFTFQNISTLLTFLVGCVVGLLSFSHVLNWMLKRYHNLTIALLTGFMVGSLNKVWPWRQVTQTYIDSKGNEKTLLDKSILPNVYEQVTGKDAEIFFAFILIVLGFAIVYLIEKWSANKNQEV